VDNLATVLDYATIHLHHTLVTHAHPEDGDLALKSLDNLSYSTEAATDGEV